MATIKADAGELLQINMEIKRTLDTLKKLRRVKQSVEKRVTDYLNQHEDIPAIKLNGDFIMLEHKQKSILKPKKEREQKLIELLESAGMRNSVEMAEKIKNLGKDKISTESIKINKKFNKEDS